jgi:hypothetical protein
VYAIRLFWIDVPKAIFIDGNLQTRFYRSVQGAYHVTQKRYDSTRFNNEINC